MTSRERLLAVLRGEIADCVPVSPDFSNMIPCKLTGKPFWDIYLFHDPPLWQAYLRAAEFFGNDIGFELYDYGPVDVVDGTRAAIEERIVYRDEERILTQGYETREARWSKLATVYPARNPPVRRIDPAAWGIPQPPREWVPVVRKSGPEGYALWRAIREEVGDSGIVGMSSGFG